MLSEISNSNGYDHAIKRLKELLDHATLSSEAELELTQLVRQIQVYEKSVVEISNQIDVAKHTEGC